MRPQRKFDCKAYTCSIRSAKSKQSKQKGHRMATTLPARLAGLGTYVPAAEDRLERYQEIYRTNYQRIYSFAFRMTDNELTAEDVVGNVFRRAFSLVASPGEEVLDRALVHELREQIVIGPLTLECSPATEVAGVRRNTKRSEERRVGKECRSRWSPY